MWSALTRQLLDAAFAEDVGPGDLTAGLLDDPARPVAGRLMPRQAGVVAGLALAPAICTTFARHLGEALLFAPALNPATRAPYADGDEVAPGGAVGELHGSHAAVLATERTLLNFVGRMSGVATLTHRYVAAARTANPAVDVLDTRKTLPGWRELDKYAVRCGGGANHRFGLYDAVLIKDNHIAGVPAERLAAHLEALLARLTDEPSFVEVEVDNLEQFAAVCRTPGADIVLLDNFTLEELRNAVQVRAALRRAPSDAGRELAPLLLEASGGVTVDTIAAIAATGVDRISVGALTHSAMNLDFGLDF